MEVRPLKKLKSFGGRTSEKKQVMKTKLKFRIVKIFVIGIVTALIFNLASPNFLENSTIGANGDLDVVWDGVPDGSPIFVVNNMLPGDMEDRDVFVTNGGTVARFVSVNGVRTGPEGESDPKLETVLDMVISDGVVDLYGGTSAGGAKTAQDFFDDSLDPNGILLSILNPGDTTTYNFKVTFPESAGNEFQAKSVIFDIIIGVVISNNIVINEVYYEVDSGHGVDSPKDRGVGQGASIIIQGNGAGSVNSAVIDIENSCTIIQNNNAQVNNNVGINVNTGNNSSSGNTGGNSKIKSGNANVNININNNVNQNNSAGCLKKPVQNHEWIELFNPTDQEVSLKNWTITDSSGISRKIPGNRKLKPNQFALISRDNSTWRFWNEDPDALKIPLGKQIGDGLDNAGDRLILRDASGSTVDQLSYGGDTSIFDPSVPLVTLGASFERLVPGFDTDAASDFEERNPPTPGN